MVLDSATLVKLTGASSLLGVEEVDGFVVVVVLFGLLLLVVVVLEAVVLLVAVGLVLAVLVVVTFCFAIGLVVVAFPEAVAVVFLWTMDVVFMGVGAGDGATFFRCS